MAEEHRYRRARELAGLALAQAATLLGLPARDLEALEAYSPSETGQHILEALQASPVDAGRLASTYRVTVCWLRGHDPKPDLTDLARQAREKDLPTKDWDKVVELVQSQALCAECMQRKVEGSERCYRCREVAPRTQMTRAAGVWWCADVNACLARKWPNEGDGRRCPCGAFCAPGQCKVA